MKRGLGAFAVRALAVERAAVAFIAALLGACGGSGGGSRVAPVISNLTYSPTAAYVNSGGGQVSIRGSFMFSGANGGVASVTIAILSSSGAELSSTTTPVPNGAGFTSGTIAGSVTAGTTTLGTYTIRVTLTDLYGVTSNALTGVFRISVSPWAAKTPMPQARDFFAAATNAGLVYIAGGEVLNTGRIPGPASSRLDVYNPATDRWSSASPMPTARVAPAAAVVGGLLYVIGGSTFPGPSLSTVEVFDPSSGTWSSRAPMPTPRSSAAAAVVAGLICVFGGTETGFPLATTECLDPASNTWSTPGPMPTPRYALGADVLGGLAYAVGGYDYMEGYVATTERYDPIANRWSSVASMWTRRQRAAVLAVSGLLFTFGGDNAEGALASVEAYDPAAGTWRFRTAMPLALERIGAVATGDAVYVFEQGHTLQYTPADEIL